ncbi:MAG: xanthine dehydrogenase family protein molybdopterin-binding subunit [Chitinophagaceae bacterium]|nr:xanthine dehydrogenase family protein molybdopterin-binding subunit [Chitinophagaceae bacterium]
MKKEKIDRRDFIKISSLASGSLVIGFMVPGLRSLALPAFECEFFQPSAYLKIDNKGKVTVYIAKQESGQGVDTALPMIVAEEMDVNFRDVTVEIAPYGTMKEGEHDTGGSQSVMQMYTPLRNAGAVAKAMLIVAAANEWKVDINSCAADNGEVVNTINMKRIKYGELICQAALLPIPKEVTLKNPGDFKIIGKSEKRSGLKDILTGKSKYGLDIKVDGMLYAVAARCPVLDGTLIKVDDTAARRVPGVIKIVRYPGTKAPMHVRAGVAVIATNTWAAIKAKKLLNITWDEGKKNNESTEALFKTFEAKAKTKPLVEIFKKGDVTKAVGKKEISAAYAEPFLAHATIEPMNFVASVKGDQLELWGGLQLPDWAVNTIASESKIKKENIKLNLTLMGGAFGRRLHFDFALEAVKIAQQIDKPVKLIWERTDDIQHAMYRPANYHFLKANTDDIGNLVSWQHHVLGTPVAFMTEGPDSKNFDEVSGVDAGFCYDIPNINNGYTPVDMNINRGWLRAVDICANTFPVECFIDEIAAALKKDPLAFRLSMLENRLDFKTGDKPGSSMQSPARIAGVLKMAADKIGYADKRKPNHFIGLATHSFIFAKAFAAHAIEIEMLKPRKFAIKRVVAAIDCGLVINPDGLMNQMQGGFAFGLTQALKGEITIANSRVLEDGFFGYELLRYDEMPAIEVFMVDSKEEPGGVGEVGVSTVAPALCNALAAAGHRPRTLPVRNEGYSWV